MNDGYATTGRILEGPAFTQGRIGFLKKSLKS
jgi:hypothetical protein